MFLRLCISFSLLALSCEMTRALARKQEEFEVNAVEKHRFATEAFIQTLACSRDGTLLAAASVDLKGGAIDLWDTSTGKKKWSIAGKVEHIALSADGQMLVASLGKTLLDDIKVHAFSAKTKKELYSFRVRSLGQVAFHPSGRLFAVYYGYDPRFVGDTIQFRNARDGELVDEFKPKEHPYSLCYSPDGKFLALLGLGKKVEIVNVTRVELHVVVETAKSPARICFSPDSKTLAMAGRKGIELFDVASGKSKQPLTGLPCGWPSAPTANGWRLGVHKR